MHTPRKEIVLFCLMGLLGCPVSKDPPPVTKIPETELKPPSASCGEHPFTPKPKGEFAHNRSSLIAAAASPAHAAQDLLYVQGNPITVKAKFAYGSFSKDLEDEPIEAFIELCAGWQSIGEFKTDDDGIISFSLTEKLGALPNGVYPLRFQVRGDASLAEATLGIYPKGTHLIVFDIDGTLTTKDEEIMKDFASELYDGKYVPEAYPGGPALTQIHYKRGAVLFYMTGRPYWLTKLTKEWLQKMGYAPATLRLTDSTEEALPSESGVGDYKMKNLKNLIAQGFVVDLAYGNAATDIYAYLGAGIDAKNAYIIGEHGGKQGTNAIAASWDTEVTRAQTLPSIEQPK